MAKQEFSISRLAELIPTETDAYKFLEELRWGGEPPACPKCGVVGDTYFIQPANGTTRKTRTGSMSPRRVWRCRACNKQFSVLTDTIFHGTRIPIRTWIFVIFDFCSAKNSMSAWEVSRKYEITNESAWHMLHRIREAMKREPLAALFSGTVASDETYIGGKPSNRSKSARAERYAKTGANYATSDKTIVLALVDTDSREVRSRVIPDVKGDTLKEAIAEQVELTDTVLVTDELKSYRPIASEFAGHETVNHAKDEYRNERGFTTNQIEGYFSQLKRSLDGTHHHVSREHLKRYLAQFDWLYTNCKATDSERMRMLVENVDGRRLPYKPLTED